MNYQMKLTAKMAIAVAATVLFQACSVKVPVASPKQSENSYTRNNAEQAQVDMRFVNALGVDHKVEAGKLANVFILEHEGKAIDAESFIKKALKNEFDARGMPVDFTDKAADALRLEHFEILSDRETGFSPMVTVSTIKMELKHADTSHTYVSMVKRAKVPVWSMDEINDPCYNEPTTLLVREIAAKINKSMFGYRLSDDKVDRLMHKISANKEDPLAYLDVYELGFSNNTKAIGYLEALTEDPHEYIRLAAVSGLGILGAEKRFDRLVLINEQSDMWQDRAMALKAIGDLGTEKAKEYLEKEKSRWEGKNTKEALWNLRIINLYL
jgi:hypothetical protein